MTSDSMEFIPSFMKIFQFVENFFRGKGTRMWHRAPAQ